MSKPKPMPNYWALAKEVTNLHGQLDKLQAENAKLREQVERLHADQAHWELDNCPSCPNVADLQEALAENAKLRELASGLHKCWVNEGCEGCPMQDGDGWCVRDIQLRELGVEVE